MNRFAVVLVAGDGSMGKHDVNTTEEVQDKVQHALSCAPAVLSITVFDREQLPTHNWAE